MLYIFYVYLYVEKVKLYSQAHLETYIVYPVNILKIWRKLGFYVDLFSFVIYK